LSPSPKMEKKTKKKEKKKNQVDCESDLRDGESKNVICIKIK
jgi:hypothetical protein